MLISVNIHYKYVLVLILRWFKHFNMRSIYGSDHTGAMKRLQFLVVGEQLHGNVINCPVMCGRLFLKKNIFIVW